MRTHYCGRVTEKALSQTVTVVGWVHGILFVAFLVLAWEYKTDRSKSLKWFAAAFIAALVPTGTFFFDKRLKEEENISTQS